MPTDENSAAIEAHVREFFAGHEISTADYDLGDGTHGAIPELRILEIGPGPRGSGWVYATVGCWTMKNHAGHGLEFVLSAPVRDQRFAGAISMTAHYNLSHHLDAGHSLPLGEQWVPGSTCEHFLIGPPYLHGPDLERCELPRGTQESSGCSRRPMPRSPSDENTAPRHSSNSSTTPRSTRSTLGGPRSFSRTLQGHHTIALLRHSSPTA